MPIIRVRLPKPVPRQSDRPRPARRSQPRHAVRTVSLRDEVSEYVWNKCLLLEGKNKYLVNVDWLTASWPRGSNFAQRRSIHDRQGYISNIRVSCKNESLFIADEFRYCRELNYVWRVKLAFANRPLLPKKSLFYGGEPGLSRDDNFNPR